MVGQNQVKEVFSMTQPILGPRMVERCQWILRSQFCSTSPATEKGSVVTSCKYPNINGELWPPVNSHSVLENGPFTVDPFSPMIDFKIVFLHLFIVSLFNHPVTSVFYEGPMADLRIGSWCQMLGSCFQLVIIFPFEWCMKCWQFPINFP